MGTRAQVIDIVAVGRAIVAKLKLAHTRGTVAQQPVSGFRGRIVVPVGENPIFPAWIGDERRFAINAELLARAQPDGACRDH